MMASISLSVDEFPVMMYVGSTCSITTGKHEKEVRLDE